MTTTRHNNGTSQRDMSDSSIRLDVDDKPSCGLLVARLFRPDSGNIRSDQQKRECFGGGLRLAVFGLFLQPR